MPIPKLVIQVGLMAAQMAVGMSRRIEGPRVQDLTVSVADYGTSVPRIWGKRRVEGCPVAWAEPIREVKRTAKTKGGKYNEYTYFGTWMVVLAAHEIAGLSRVWFDKKLVLDFSGAGPVTPFEIGFTQVGKIGTSFRPNSLNEHYTLYTGSEAQAVDERIAATTEAQFGPDSATAYRGLAYLMFKDVPVEKFGNRIPTVDVELLGTVSNTFPKEVIDVGIDAPFRLRNMAFAPDYSRFMWTSIAGGYEIFDVAARASIISGATGANLDDQHSGLGVYSDGRWLACTQSFADVRLVMFDADGTGYAEVIDFGALPERQDDVWVLTDGNGIEHWLSRPFQAFTPFFVDGVQFDLSTITGIANLQPKGYFVDAYGDIWAFAQRAVNNQTTAYFYRVIDCGTRGGPSFVTVTGLANRVSYDDEFDHEFAGVTHYLAGGLDQFVFYWAGNLYAADATTGAINASQTTITIEEKVIAKNLRWCPPGSWTVWIYGTAGAYEISLADLSIMRTYALTSGGPWGAVSHDSDSGLIYCPPLHALIAPHATLDKLQILYLDRLDSPGVTLQQVVEDVCGLAGLLPDEINAAALTQVIPGYMVTQGSGKDWIEPLLDLYDVDARPHGFQLQFVNRGAAVGGTLSAPGFARAGDEPVYNAPREGGSDAPGLVTLLFADIAKDQQTNAALSGPLFELDSRRAAKIDMSSLVLGVDAARQLTARWHRRRSFEGQPYNLALPPSAITLEPADVRALALPDGLTVTARLQSMVLGADGRIETEWRRDDPSVAVLTNAAGATMDGRPDTVIAVPLLSKGFVLDLPLLKDSDSTSNPLLYIAAAPYAAGTWPGATVFRQIGGEYSDEEASVPAGSAVTWGYTTAALGSANPNLWDRGGSVNVKLQWGTLTGCTEDDIDAQPTLNLALIGSELINFTTATLEGDGSYTLSGFKRGRRGTEWAIAGHAVRENFALLDTVQVAELGLSDVAVNQSFKAVTEGRTASSAFAIAVSPFTGASLKPYAPCHLRELRDAASGDWALSWVRRTRVGGAWTGGATIPLGETSEEYKVEILNGGTVVRTVTGLTSPALTYTAAQQTTDFGSPQTSLSWRVCQVSAAVGDGFKAAT